ncbi:MAG: hypothetical protein GPOALKHO_001969 [Sodalis sp.]|nr:MAG: hypothetical protein GPOALKHO_001969 [Sodalis sp.]
MEIPDGDMGDVGPIEVLMSPSAGDLVANKQDISQCSKQVCLQRANDAAIDKRFFRRVYKFQFALCYCRSGSRIEHRQRTVAKQPVEISLLAVRLSMSTLSCNNKSMETSGLTCVITITPCHAGIYNKMRIQFWPGAGEPAAHNPWHSDPMPVRPVLAK